MNLEEELASATTSTEALAIANRHCEKMFREHEARLDQTVMLEGHGLMTMRNALAVVAAESGTSLAPPR